MSKTCVAYPQRALKITEKEKDVIFIVFLVLFLIEV